MTSGLSPSRESSDDPTLVLASSSGQMISDHFGRDSDKESPGLSRTASAVNPYAQAKSGSGNMLGAVLKKQSSFDNRRAGQIVVKY